MDLFDHAQMVGRSFPIEHGIPVASDRTSTRNQKWKRPEFPFSGMMVGDSFVCWPDDVGGAPLIVTQNIVSGAAATFAKNYPGPGTVKFTTRQMRGGYVRCWRIA